MRGYLGAHTLQEFIDRWANDTRMECHTTVDYEGVHTSKTFLKQIEDGDAHYCAGAIIMFANECKMSRDPERPRLPPNGEAVFSNRLEFRAHHTKEEG